VYVFETPLGTCNIDSVIGYTVLDAPTQLSAAIFAAAGPAGTLAAGAFNTCTAATWAVDRIVYNKATGAILYDADGLAGAAAVQFATLPGLVGTLTAGDFVLS
jgi:Ca2+-binding RTX toxin-like protein